MRVNDKKTAILNAAQDIFSSKGLADANISEIAKEAGVTDSIIYHYFKGKEDILFSLLDEKMKQSTQELSLHLKGIFEPASKLGKMIWFHIYMLDKTPGETRVLKNLLLECRANKNFYSHNGYESLRQYTRFLLSILRSGMEEGAFRSDLNAHLVRDMIFGLLDEVSLSYLTVPGDSHELPGSDDIMALILPMISADQPPAPQDQNKADRILSAAEFVFAEKGYPSATMAEVASLAGVAEGTIYSYFKNKQDLLFSLPRNRFEEFKKKIESVFQDGNILDKFRLFIWQHFSLLLSNRNFLKVFLTDIKLNRQFYSSDVHPVSLKYITMLDSILDQGKKEGIFRPTLNNSMFRLLFLGSFSHLAMRWYVVVSNRPYDIFLEVDQVTKLFCRGIIQPGVLPDC